METSNLFPDNITLILKKDCFDSLDINSRAFSDQFMDLFDCPVARAFKRQFPKESVRVSPSYITIMRGGIDVARYFPEKHYLQADEFPLGKGLLENVAKRLLSGQTKVMLKLHQ